MKKFFPFFALLALSALPVAAQTSVKKTTLKAPQSRPATAPKRTVATAKPAPAKPAPVAQSAASAPKPAADPAPRAEAPQPVARRTEPAPTRQAATSARPVSQRSRASRAGSSGENPLYLNAGIGLASYWGGGLPIGVSAEKTIRENISVGGSVDYARYGYNSGGYRWNYSFIYAGARASYHFGELLNLANDRFDPYAGASLGFRHASYRDNSGYGYDYRSPYNSGLYLGVHAGARYLFTPKFGGFAEVGYGIAALKVGVTVKL